jgi:hypothetical protein
VLALTAVNLNEKYLACVPSFIEFWLTLRSERLAVAYEPKVLVIANALPAELERYREWCEVLTVHEGISSTFGSQMVRILYPSVEDADLVLTTDVDMLPISDRVFQRAIGELEKGAEFVICRDVLAPGQYPICYNIASPGVWRQLNGIGSHRDLHSNLKSLFERFSDGVLYMGTHGGSGWFADQEVLYSLVEEFKSQGGRVAKLSDKQTSHLRLDRLFMPFPINWLLIPALLLGLFTDYHVHHPVSRYKLYLKVVRNLRDRQAIKFSP